MPPSSGLDNIDALVKSIKGKIPGYDVVIGGEDLQRARAALAGSRGLQFDVSTQGSTPSIYTSAATKAIQTAHALSAALEKQRILGADDRLAAVPAEVPAEAALPSPPTNDVVNTPSNATELASDRQDSMPTALATPKRSDKAVAGGFGHVDRTLSTTGVAGSRQRENVGSRAGQTPMSDLTSFSDSSESEEVILAVLRNLPPSRGTADGSKLAMTPESEKDVRVRELAMAAMKYAAVALQRPGEYDVEYNHGLVLQELASYVSHSGRRHTLLVEACNRYAAAAKASPTAYAAPYNWAVALGDLAALLRRDDPEGAEECLRQASHRYAQSVELSPANPQTLNNWGLVLQELALQLPLRERRIVTQQAAAKFRMAIRHRPDYDRCCYNLGTVCYRYAMQLQNDQGVLTRNLQQYAVGAASQKSPDKLATQVAALEDEIREHKAEAERLVKYAATYISLASALQPLKPTYKQALSILQKLLPADGVMAGSLLVSQRSSRSEHWRRSKFLLTHEHLRSLPQGSTPPLAHKGGYLAGLTPGVTPLGAPDAPMDPHADEVVIGIADVTQVLPCMDPSLPEGHAFWVCLQSRPEGVFFVAEHQEDAEVWVDAITLVSHILQQSQAVPYLS